MFDLNTRISLDPVYRQAPSLTRLCKMIADLMHTWERLTAENLAWGKFDEWKNFGTREEQEVEG